MKKVLPNLILWMVFSYGVFAQNNCMEMGINLRGFNLWQREYEQPLADVMKSCLTWSTQNNNSTSPGNTNVLASIPLDADGYPLSLPVTVAGQTQPQVVATTMLNNINGQYPAGEYVVLYDGTGTFQFGGSAAVTSTTPGRITLNVATPNNGGIFLKILTSSAADHVRNIRVLMPGTEFTYQTQPFNQAFLDRIAPFSVLRFLWWTFTNSNDNVTWANRRLPSYYTQATYGAVLPRLGCAYEYVIDLGNITQKDIWINVPAQADTNYIRQMAVLFRDSLNVNSKIYLEYSNEVWNPVMWFEQNWVNTNGPATLPNLAQKYAYFADRVFDIWASEFGASFSSRVVRVAACQNGNPWVGQQVMNYLSANGGADVLSPAAYIDLRPYYYDSLDVLGAAVTPVDVIRLMRKSFTELKIAYAGNKATADTYGLPIAYYEGGQHLVPEGGTSHPYNQAMFDAQIDTAMYNVYHELLSYVRDTIQASLFTHFNTVSDRENTQLGSFGALENIYQLPPYLEVAPKYQALLDFIPNIPVPVISGNAAVCGNSTTTYATPPGPAGSTYIWSVTGGTIISGQGTNQITVQWSNGVEGTVSVIQQNP